MGTYLVNHEWNASRSDEVKSVVSSIIEKERNSSLPSGFHLLWVMLSSTQPRAYCVWEAQSKRVLEDLLASVNPPTKYAVEEYQILYGESRITAV
ncbi:MAG: hypothetical protein JRN15_04580 [Nitrososphaerota archaeon]|nr:hypothetical protein [Nitrososphaerota archaeon]